MEWTNGKLPERAGRRGRHSPALQGGPDGGSSREPSGAEQLRVRTQTNELQRGGVRFAVDRQRIRAQVALPTTLPRASERMIGVAGRKGPITGEELHYAGQRAPDVHAVAAPQHPAVIALECRRAENFPHSAGIQIGDEVRRVADADELSPFSRSNGRDGLFVGRMGGGGNGPALSKGSKGRARSLATRTRNIRTAVERLRPASARIRAASFFTVSSTRTWIVTLIRRLLPSGDCTDSVMERIDNGQPEFGWPHSARTVPQASRSPGGGRPRGRRRRGSREPGRDAPPRRRAGRPCVRGPRAAQTRRLRDRTGPVAR